MPRPEGQLIAKWQELWRDVQSRVCMLGEPPRFMYFTFVVVIVGGLGAWRHWAYYDLLQSNLATYALGISAAAGVELVMPDHTSRSLRMFAISLGIVGILASVIHLFIGLNHVVWLAAGCSWLLWILSSSQNTSLGSVTPGASTGGPLDSMAGNLQGFDTDQEPLIHG